MHKKLSTGQIKTSRCKYNYSSSHNHGSVENGSLQDEFPPHIGSFSMLGGRIIKNHHQQTRGKIGTIRFALVQLLCKNELIGLRASRKLKDGHRQKIAIVERKIPFQTIILRIRVSFSGCRFFFPSFSSDDHQLVQQPPRAF